MVGNIVEKGENAGDQHFVLFSQGFQKVFSSEVSIKVGIVWERVMVPSPLPLLNSLPHNPGF